MATRPARPRPGMLPDLRSPISRALGGASPGSQTEAVRPGSAVRRYRMTGENRDLGIAGRVQNPRAAGQGRIGAGPALDQAAMRRGRPVEPEYSAQDSPLKRGLQGVATAQTALDMGLGLTKPPAPRAPAAPRASVRAQPIASPGALPRRVTPGPGPSLNDVAAGKPHTPGYGPFPAARRKK